MADKFQIPMTSAKGVLLKTQNKFCGNDIEVKPELEELTITENGEYTPTKVGYSKVSVQVESGGGGGGSLDGFHAVRFYNDDRTTLLYTVYVPSGSSAIYAGETPISTEDNTLVFTEFEPSAVNVTADMDCYAVYEAAITTLNAASWAQISKLSADGTAQNYFAVGDTKTIHIEGTVGTLEVNKDYDVYIIGFNHNAEFEGTGIHFGTFKTSDGTNICLTDEYLKTSNAGIIGFNIQHWGEHRYGGWKRCDLRYDVLGSTDIAPDGYGANGISGQVGYDASEACATSPVPNTLMEALPAELRSVMKPMLKYAFNGDNNIAESVTATIDYLPLLSEYELTGSIYTGSSLEKTKQSQYDYYKLGNSGKKYGADGTAVYWWLRSPYVSSDDQFVVVGTDGSASNQKLPTEYRIGIAPIFKV